MAAAVLKSRRAEIALVLDQVFRQERLSDLGLSEEEIIRPRCPSDVVADAVADDEDHSLEHDVEIDGGDTTGRTSKLDKEQEKAVNEVALALRHIGDEFSIDGHPLKICDAGDRQRRISREVMDNLLQLADADKFQKYIEKQVNSHDSNLRQLAQVVKLTNGLMKVFKQANESVANLRENATDYVNDHYRDWIENEGGLVQAVSSAVQAVSSAVS